MTTNLTDRNIYGAREVAGLVNGAQYHKERGICEKVDWTTPGLKVTRLRLISDPGFPQWDVSYCHGELDGKSVDVVLPFNQLPKRRMISAIIEHAKRANVFAKGIGILDNISTCC